jgi:hypothetical protein
MGGEGGTKDPPSPQNVTHGRIKKRKKFFFKTPDF